MQKVRKPRFYKELEICLKEQYEDSDFELFQINYLGSVPSTHGSTKSYNFLVLTKDEKGKLCIWLDKLVFQDGYADIIDSTDLDLPVLEYIKNMNLDTLKVLYGGV